MARARRTDPDTSHAAAASVRDETVSRRAGWQVLLEGGPMTDYDLISRYQKAAIHGLVPQQSDSGIRTRRNELYERGWVENTQQKVRLASGRKAILWRAVEASERSHRLGAPQGHVLGNRAAKGSGEAQASLFDTDT